MRTIGIVILAITLSAPLCRAQGSLIKKQVVASVEYKGAGLLGGKVPSEAKQQAEDEARAQAWRLYLSDCSPARCSILEKMNTELLPKFNDIMPSVTVLSERQDKDRKRFEISATVPIDVKLVDALVAAKHTSSSSPQAKSADRAPLVFVFIARKIGSIVTSDGKRVEFTKNTSTKAEAERSTVRGEDVVADYSLDDLQVKEYGGKNIEKAQEVQWVAESVSSLDAAVNEVFTQAGYECTDPADVEGFNLQSFRDDYGAGDDVTPVTRQQANRLLKEFEVGYFATGRMDISLPSVNEVNGLPTVYVKVEAKVTDLRSKLPKTVASVSGEYYQGSGPNVQVATQNALLAAARQAAKQLSDQLMAKGL